MLLCDHHLYINILLLPSPITTRATNEIASFVSRLAKRLASILGSLATDFMESIALFNKIKILP